MKTVSRSHKLDNVCYDIRGPIAAQARKMEDEGHRILKLNIGNPAPSGFEAPDDIVKDVIHNLPTSQGYSDSTGIYAARVAVMQYYQQRNIKDIRVDDVYIGNGVSELIMMAMQALLNHGDEVLIPSPDYPLWTAAVSLSSGSPVHYRCDEQADWYPDIDNIKKNITPNTKALVLINPNNPTGSLISEEMLNDIAEIARTCDAYLLSDEVYRGTDQEGSGFTKSVADIYEKGISTASMSKSFSLAGLRLGWIAGPQDVIESVSIHRDYNTISVGMLDDHFAAIALENKDKIIARSQDITRTNLKILDEWVSKEPLISYVKPKSGTTALLKYHLDMNSREFCIKLLKQTGVMLTPGSALDIEGYVRIGYANNVEILKSGLDKITEFLANPR